MRERSGQQCVLYAGVVDLNDLAHRVHVGEPDVVEKAAPQEGVRQFFFVIGCDDDDGPLAGGNGLSGLIDVEFHPVEFLQQIVRKLDVRLVDLIDQQDHAALGLKRLPQLALLDVVADIIDFFVTQLAISKAADGIVFIKALLRLGGGFDVPFDHRQAKCGTHLSGKFCLAGARLTFDQQGPLKGHSGVNCDGQIVGCHVTVGASELHVASPYYCPNLGGRYHA